MLCRYCSTSSQAVSSASSSVLVALAGVVLAPRESCCSSGWFFRHACYRRVTLRRSSTGSWNFSDALPALLGQDPLALALDHPASLHRGDGGEAYDFVEATDAGCVGIVALLERGRRETAFDLLNDPAGLQAIGVLLEDLEHRLQDLSCPLAGDLSQSSSPPGPAPYKGDDPRTTRGLPSIDNSGPGVPR